MTYLWVIKYVCPFLIGGMLFGGVAWKIQDAKVIKAKSELAVVKDANAENIRTIDALKSEITKGNKSCQERLASKDATIRKLKEIDNMGGYNESNGTNPLRDALNGLYGS